MSTVQVIVLIFALCFYEEFLCAKLITSKEFSTDRQHFTWNFVFSDKPSDINFNNNQEIEVDSNGPHHPNKPTGAENPNGGKLVPLDIDIRFGDTDIEVPDPSLHSRCQKCSNDGVYWREWNGAMPTDAIVAGHTTNQCGLEVPIYLAQSYVSKAEGGLQPGQLFNYSKELTTSFAGIHKMTKTVKVLCSGDKQAVAWVSYSKVKNLQPDEDCVVAGFERDFNLFFGRAKHNNEVIIGKVVIKNNVMYYPKDGKEMAEKNFEVLCYRRKLLENNIKPDDN